jgi:WD40 repeat protein
MLAEATCTCRILETVFSPDGRRAAIVSDANSIYIRSTDTGDPGFEIDFGGTIGNVAFSPDGTLIGLTGEYPVMAETEGNLGKPSATGQSEPWQSLWEVRSSREIELEQERAETYTVVFSADARYLAAGSVVWDTTSGRRVARAEEPILAFSPDQRVLITRGAGAVRAWPWRSEDLLALACTQLTRNLSAEEWQRHVSREEPPQKTCARLP